MVYKIVGIKTSGNGIKNENMSNKELAKELRKPIIRKFQEKKVHLPFIDNIRGTGLVDMQMISKCNWDLNVHYVLLAFISRYAGVIPLKDKRHYTY